MQAGGLLEAAATTKVEVARRMKDTKSTSFSTTVGQNFSFDLKDGLWWEKEARISILNLLMKFIFVRVRLILNNRMLWWEEKFLFSGNYALSKKNERLSDLIAKAGGVTPDAYVKGARLIRRMTEEEFRRKEDALAYGASGR